MSKEQADIDFQNKPRDPDWEVGSDKQVVPQNFFGEASDMEGEFDQGDVGLPRLSLIHPLDKRAVDGTYRPGMFVYNNEVELDRPFPLVVIKSVKKYYEKIDRKTNPTGIARIVGTAAEVRALGGSFDYPCPHGSVPFGDLGELLVLIGQKENEAFPFEYDGDCWAPAIYRAKGTAYTRVVKPLAAARALSLRAGLIHGLWTMDTARETINNNPTFVPVFKFARKNTPEFVEWLRELLAGFSKE